MATGPTALQVIRLLPPLVELLPSTLERQLRAQRLAGQLPTGRPGGGKFSAHFEAQHFTNIILGLAGPEPSAAPDAAESLRSLPFRPDQSHLSPRAKFAPLPTLEDQIANWIGWIAGAYRRGGQYQRYLVPTFARWSMSLCLNPRWVFIQDIVKRADGESVHHIVYGLENSGCALRRVTVISGELMLFAGKLLAASHEQIEAIVAKVSSTQPASTAAEQESAGNLRQEAPAPSS